MERNNRHSRKHRNWNEQKKQNNNRSSDNLIKPPKTSFHFISHENIELLQKKEKAIQELKGREVICPKCNERITDVASSITDKQTGKPVHFECIMKQLEQSESLSQNEKIAYIGQGRFAVLSYDNIRDQKHFKIKKTIEIEDRDNRADWRLEMSSLYSQIE